MAAYRIARILGWPVARVLDELSVEEFMGWCAFLDLECSA